MGPASFYALPLLLSLGTTPTPIQTAKPGLPTAGGYLSEEDAVYLDYVVHEYLFDPKHAVRVRLISRAETSRLEYSQSLFRFQARGSERDGWLVRGRDGQPDRVYFTDGDSVPASTRKLQPVDFEAQCAERFRERSDRRTDRLIRLIRSLDSDSESDLTLAAWLHRRGHDGLAARALDAARDVEDEEPLQELRNQLARQAHEAMVQAVGVRDDTRAMDHARRISQLYSDLLAKRMSGSALVVDELKRRQAAGTFGKAPEKDWPKGFANWDAAKRVKYLIESLDQIMFEQKQRTSDDVGFDSEWSLVNDRRCVALLDVGDAAVPGLLDAIENDKRLTRCSEWHRGFRGIDSCFIEPRLTPLIAVHEVALHLVQNILKVRYFDPLQHVKSEDESRAATLAKIQQYWAMYGHLSFDDRMMAILTDSKARPEARNEAARLLISAEAPTPRGWIRTGRDSAARRRDPAYLINRYKSPSVAEAILTAMQDERNEASAKARDDRFVGHEADYLQWLSELEDHRVGAELAGRASRATNVFRRIRYAESAHRLGYSGPLIALARDFQTGSIALVPAAARQGQTLEAGERAIHALVGTLIDSELREADDALWALANPDHPYFAVASYAALNDLNKNNHSAWSRHPFFLGVLVHSLSNSQTTGANYYVRGERLETSKPMGRKSDKLDDVVGTGVACVEHAEERVADVVAAALGTRVCGLPDTHPVRRNQDDLILRGKDYLRLHLRRLRALSREEENRIGIWSPGVTYLPDIKPLALPATEEDVRRGFAIFALKGGGKVADNKLPAWLLLRSAAKDENPHFGLVVQAETDADGKLVYGVIFRHEIRAVKAEEVERIEAYSSK